MELHFAESGSFPITVTPSSYALCTPAGGTCTAQTSFSDGDKVGVDGPGIDPIVGYFRVKSSIR